MVRKILSLLICFGKFVIFNEVILKLCLEGRKVYELEWKLLDLVVVVLFVDEFGFWNCRNLEWVLGICMEGGFLELYI